ncbi:hypothetical protein JW916_10165 [Candidatus Sumerlaeota bacterium]|nr:hypothetical protein [Candidatus Sumerlaeota bacterium]
MRIPSPQDRLDRRRVSRIPLLNRASRIGAALALCWMLCSCSALAGSKGGIERAGEWLSADTVALVACQDADRARERWKETAMGKAWSDVAVDYWRSQQLEPVVNQLLERIGAPGTVELLGLVSGDAIVALEVPEQADGSSAPVVAYAFLDFGEKNGVQARSLVSSSALGHRGTKKGKNGEPDVELHGPAGGTVPVLFSAWADDTWIVSSSEEGLTGLLRRRAGGKTASLALKKSDRWRRAAAQARSETDAFAFVDVGRIYRTANRHFQGILETRGLYDIQDNTQALVQLLGLESVEFVALTTEMRGPGFYSRSLVESAEGAKGLLHALREGPPLQTPRWVTKDLSGFSVARAMTPLELKKAIVQFADIATPQGGETVDALEQSFEAKTGVNLDAMLSRVGTERAMLAGASAGLPDIVMLFESSAPSDLVADIVRCLAAAGWRSTKGSMAGMPYETVSSPQAPLNLFVAPVEGFAMLGTSNRWLSGFAQRREERRAQGAKVDPKFPAGPNSLLPLLDEPFGRPPRGTTVVGRSYSNPGPSLAQMNMFIPLAVPMIDLQLARSGLPSIPSWVVSALPPIPPFATNIFPTVSRAAMRDTLVVSEKYSAFDPVLSPFSAAALVIGAKFYLEKGDRSRD